jgi:hypothetical protein
VHCECLQSLPVEEPLLLERDEVSGALLVFDRQTGTLSEVREEGALQPLLLHHGRAVQVAVSEGAQRLVVLEASGALHLKELGTGITVALLELCTEGQGRRVLHWRRPGLVVPFPPGQVTTGEAATVR